MARYEIAKRALARAPREVVWELVADTRRWPDWGPWPRISIEREGTPPPCGVGALRAIVLGPAVAYEEITEFEPPRRLAYVLDHGTFELRGYRGEVTLSDSGGGTEIDWRIHFDAGPFGSGPLFRISTDRFIASVTKRLARGAELEAQAAHTGHS